MIELKNFQNVLTNSLDFYELSQDDSVIPGKYNSVDFKTHFTKTRVLFEEMKNKSSNFQSTSDTVTYLPNKIKVSDYITFGYSEPKVTEKYVTSVRFTDTTRAVKDLQKLQQNPEIPSVENFFDGDGVPDDFSGIVGNIDLVEIPQQIDPTAISPILYCISVLCVFSLVSTFATVAILYYVFGIEIVVSVHDNPRIPPSYQKKYLKQIKYLSSIIFSLTGSYYLGYFSGAKDSIKLSKGELKESLKNSLTEIVKKDSFFYGLVKCLFAPLFLFLEIFFD